MVRLNERICHALIITFSADIIDKTHFCRRELAQRLLSTAEGNHHFENREKVNNNTSNTLLYNQIALHKLSSPVNYSQSFDMSNFVCVIK